MARAIARRPQVVVVGTKRKRRRAPARKRRRSIGRRAKRAVRRGASAAAKAAWDEKHTLFAVAAGVALGAVKAKKWDEKIPHVKQIGVAGTYGLGAWLAGKYLKNPMIQHLATGMLTIGAYEAGQYFFQEAAATTTTTPTTSGYWDPGALGSTVFEDEI